MAPKPKPAATAADPTATTFSKEMGEQAARRACEYGLAVNQRVRLWDIGYASFPALRTIAYVLLKCDLVLEVEAHETDANLVKLFAVRRECRATTKS